MAAMKLRGNPDPKAVEQFISQAKADLAEAAPIKTHPSPRHIDPRQLVKRTEWPIVPSSEPFLGEGRGDIDRPLNMRLKENLWQTLADHCQSLGIEKSQWVRRAILNQLAAEQEHFTEKTKDGI